MNFKLLVAGLCETTSSRLTIAKNALYCWCLSSFPNSGSSFSLCVVTKKTISLVVFLVTHLLGEALAIVG